MCPILPDVFEQFTAVTTGPAATSTPILTGSASASDRVCPSGPWTLETLAHTGAATVLACGIQDHSASFAIATFDPRFGPSHVFIPLGADVKPIENPGRPLTRTGGITVGLDAAYPQPVRLFFRLYRFDNNEEAYVPFGATGDMVIPAMRRPEETTASPTVYHATIETGFNYILVIWIMPGEDFMSTATIDALIERPLALVNAT